MTTHEEDRAGVLAAVNLEAQAIEAGDPRTYCSLLASDAVFLPPNTSPKIGDELRKWLADFLAGTRVEYLNNVDVETVIESSLAYHVFTCTWRVAPRAGGEPKILHFKGLHILRREAGGAWKIAREIWNTSPASP